MWTFRRMGKVSFKDRKTNAEVCDLLEVRPTLLNTIKSRKLKFFGHTRRHDGVVRDVLEGKVDGKRARGRPPRSWMNDVKDWTGLSAAECNIKAMDRAEWRAISSRPPKR